jgi:hypothetical protein
VKPSPVKPGLHVQVYESAVFAQAAFGSQAAVWSAHSSTSVVHRPDSHRGPNGLAAHSSLEEH